jgi:hypothetical protein
VSAYAQPPVRRGFRNLYDLLFASTCGAGEGARGNGDGDGDSICYVGPMLTRTGRTQIIVAGTEPRNLQHVELACTEPHGCLMHVGDNRFRVCLDCNRLQQPCIVCYAVVVELEEITWGLFSPQFQINSGIAGRVVQVTTACSHHCM